MKSTLTLLSLILISFTAQAQKVDFGVRLGLSQSTLVENYNGQTSSNAVVNDIEPALYAELNYNNLTIQPGLALNVKGGGGSSTISSIGGSFYQTSSSLTTIFYLDVPINIIYNIPVKASKFFIGAGPYWGVALDGHTDVFTDSYSSNGNSQSKTSTAVTFGSGTNDIQRFEYGINMLGGFRLKKHWEFGVAYALGLSNLANQSNVSVKNRTSRHYIWVFFLNKC